MYIFLFIFVFFLIIAILKTGKMKTLWSKDIEKNFFYRALQLTTPESIFYKTNDGRYLAYWPKNYQGEKTTLQSRNAFIGDFTEKWALNLLRDFAREKHLYAVQGVICEEIELKRQSPADIAICKTDRKEQIPENIVLIFEVKMSIVWNWEYKKENEEDNLICIGDYTTHRGTPGLLRSDTMLKAIGKSINIRVSSFKANKIPIIILGNTPIQQSYYKKVDHLKKFGIIQGFWSLNPKPLDTLTNPTLKSTQEKGFIRIDSYREFLTLLNELSLREMEFFSGMKTKEELGKIIEIANREDTYIKKAEKFLELLRS